MSRALYMVVERFKNKDAVAALEGLVAKFERCYRVMETHDRRLLAAVAEPRPSGSGFPQKSPKRLSTAPPPPPPQPA